MNDFKDCYQSAVKDMNMLGMKKFHMDASSCIDERRHNRWVIRRMRSTAVTAFSAACVIFLCGFGTVKAAEYIENVIKVNEWGFESADTATMARTEAGNPSAYIVSEEVELVQDEEKAEAEDMHIYREEDVETESILETEGAASDSALSVGIEGKETVKSSSQNVMPVKYYPSLVEFEKNEDIIFPQPSININAEVESANVTVCGEWAMVRYDMDGKVIWVERTDYANTQGHASSKVFPGGVCNERQYTTAQGYTYTLVDSIMEKEGEQLQIHGAVTVGTYEAYIDFMGYTEEEAKEIIESIDLSLYE